MKDIMAIWEELSSLTGQVIIIGDFNMVEHVEDRWEGKGIVLRGQEELDSWNAMKHQLDLVNVGNIGEYTWQNCSPPPLA